MVCWEQVRLLDLIIGLLPINVGLCVGVALARLCCMLLRIGLWLIVLDILLLGLAFSFICGVRERLVCLGCVCCSWFDCVWFVLGLLFVDLIVVRNCCFVAGYLIVLRGYICVWLLADCWVGLCAAGCLLLRVVYVCVTYGLLVVL